MPFYNDHDDDVFGATSSQFLSPSKPNLSKSASRKTINGRRSTSSLRGQSNATQAYDDDAANGRFSLAHELAVALMPEPTIGSKSLAEEFGIEYDEGAEGIDIEPEVTVVDGEGYVEESELDPVALDASSGPPSFSVEPPTEELGTQLGSPTPQKQKRQEQDAMTTLSRDLEITDKFLNQLQHLDVEPSGFSAPTLEKLASDVIRHINETARDREGQVRALLEYEREFRKISGEVGGNDVLGRLDELEAVEGLSDQVVVPEHRRQGLENLVEVQEEIPHTRHASWNDWETDPHDHHLGDADDDESSEPPSPSPMKDSFLQAPSSHGPPSVAKTLPHLVHMRTLTTSLASSLAVISEHAQVNGAANAEAGRKIRALKNKLGGWRTDWDSAERSRIKIEKWEAGIDDDTEYVTGTPPRPSSSKRVDGRNLVKEHLHAFEIALADAGLKTQAIMTTS